jgi:hypothetical protein
MGDPEDVLAIKLTRSQCNWAHMVLDKERNDKAGANYIWKGIERGMDQVLERAISREDSTMDWASLLSRVRGN